LGDISISIPESWQPKPITPQLGEARTLPGPSILARSDGVCLFYGGKLNVIFGPSETGKTWVALRAAVDEVQAGHPIVYLDFEDDLSSMGERTIALGLDDTGNLFHYARVEEPIGPDQMATLLGWLKAISPSLVVIDSMDELLAMHGKSPNDSQQVREVRQLVIDPISMLGISVLVVDHTNKQPSTPGPGGSQAKLSQVPGAVLRTELVQAWGRGEDGLIRLRIHKDRPGHLRGKAVEKNLIAIVEFHSLAENALDVLVVPPPTIPGTKKYSHEFLLDQVQEYLATLPNQRTTSMKALFQGFRDSGGRGREANIREAVNQGVSMGTIRVIGNAIELVVVEDDRKDG
jgi:AAA domain-containing protein